jgi:hypothetical protein
MRRRRANFIRQDGDRAGRSERVRLRGQRGGDVVITHHGRRATVLRGPRAVEFVDEVESGDAQQVMARWTGNYKRGNERSARAWGQGSYVWNNTGDKVTFKNSSGQVVDTWAYAGDSSYVTC